MTTNVWRIVVVGLAVSLLAVYLIGCGTSGVGNDRTTALVVTGFNVNPVGGENVHLWAVAGPAQVPAALTAPQGVDDTPHTPPGGQRVVLSERYSAWDTGARNLPDYVTVYAGRGVDPNLGSRRIDLPTQTYDPVGRIASPRQVFVHADYSDGVSGPVWDITVDY